jgi:hypothetical protein
MVMMILKQTAIERELFAKTIEGITRQMDEHNQRAISSNNVVNEAHGYQRQEHIRMLDELNKLCNTVDTLQNAVKVHYENLKEELKKLKGDGQHTF